MKALGIMIIGLGIVLIVIGVMGTQDTVLADLKAVSPALRNKVGIGGGSPYNAPGGPGSNTGRSPGLSSGPQNSGAAPTGTP